jgi:GntR family transcriptional regulator/MocR family aminotransferase
MFTVTFDEASPEPLYLQIYESMKNAIVAGDITGHLPSTRGLAGHLGVSRTTVDSAYAQLLCEGYIYSVAKKGYFTAEIVQMDGAQRGADTYWGGNASTEAGEPTAHQSPAPPTYDLSTNAVDTSQFPYSVWSRLMRSAMRTDHAALLAPIHPQGDLALRTEIAHYLATFRAMQVAPEQIVLGAGTEYLLGLITELLPEAVFAYEDPGYQKVAQVLASRRTQAIAVPTDWEGPALKALRASGATVALTTPSHQFPLGIVTTIARRHELLRWADEEEGRYVIEDDFDSEFSFAQRPVPALHTLDQHGQVIYLNSFAKTLAPSLRIAYMVLPEPLLRRYQRTLTFYSCTVSAFEQHTLERFLREGHYERHLRRMIALYKRRQGTFLAGLAPLQGRLTVHGQKAGLHLLLEMPDLPEAELVQLARATGVGVTPLSSYYATLPPDTHTVVAGYAGLSEEDLRRAAVLLCAAWTL